MSGEAGVVNWHATFDNDDEISHFLLTTKLP